jgi:hypothetical protein
MHIRVTLTILLFFTISANLFAVELPTTEGNDVINYLNKSNYQNWQLWPNKSERYESSPQHGPLITIYVSKKAHDVIEKKKGPIPAREFIVMESYTRDKKLRDVVVMYKFSGYSPRTGDWVWVKSDAEGGILDEGKILDCINCHYTRRSNDWLFSGELK